MIEVALSIAFPVCFVVMLIGCLNCLVKKKRMQAVRSWDSTEGRHSTAFAVDICDIPSTSEQVSIEPLPDILSKVSIAPPLRPHISYAERGKQQTTLPVVSVQMSFPRDQLTYLNEIGSGWFGKVIESEAVQIVGGSYKNHVVVKMLKDDASKLEQKQFLDEVTAFRCLEDVNIMSLLGQCTETAPFLVILEFAAYSNLKSYLVENRQNLDEMVAKNRLTSFALDAASGLACLHRHDYIHNDLAARNCLVMSDYTVKIGDYGISDHLFKNEYYNTGSQLLPIRWMAPERLNKVDNVWTTQSHDKTSDMWSFGILLWEIGSVGERPYDMLTDEAVLQGVVLDRLVLPSDVDIRLPRKDRMWSIMVQCWQDASDRLDVEQVCNNLEQLNRVRVDTVDAMSDFDQKWSQLKQNQAITSSNGIDLGSRLALAGSFATDDSNSPTDKPSFLYGDSEVQDGVKNDDLILDMDVDGSYASINHDNHSVPISLQPIEPIVDSRQSTVQDGEVISSSQNHVFVENEFTKTSVSPSHLTPTKSPSHRTPTKSPDHAVVTNALQGQSSMSNIYLPNSPLSGKYMVVKEIPEVKDFRSVDSFSSLDVEGKTFQDMSDGDSQKSAQTSNDVSKFGLSLQADDEDYSEFVRTSPTAPSVDFTDFASADSDLSEVEHVRDHLNIETDASLRVTDEESTTYASVADNSFSDFTKAGDENSNTSDENSNAGDENSNSGDENGNADDDFTPFSDFLTSTPLSKVDSPEAIAVESDITAHHDTNTGLTQSLANEVTSSNFNKDLLALDMSSPSSVPESYSKNENISFPILAADIHSQVPRALEDSQQENEANSAVVDISWDKFSTEKIVPDQNQNVFSSEQISSDMPSLTSDASFFSDFGAATVSDKAPLQSKQLKANTDSDLGEHSEGTNSLIPLNAPVPAVTDALQASSTDIFFSLQDNSSEFYSSNFQDQRLTSISPLPTDAAAFNHEDKTENHKEIDVFNEKAFAIAPLQSKQLESNTDSDLGEHSKGTNSLIPLNAPVPAVTDALQASSTDIFFSLQDNSSEFYSSNFQDQRLTSISLQPTDAAAFNPDKTSNDKEEYENQGEKSNRISFSTDHLIDVNVGPQNTTPNGSAPEENFEKGKQVKTAELHTVKGFKPVAELLDLELSPLSSSLHAEQGDLLTNNHESGGGTGMVSTKEGEGSVVDF